MTELRDIINEVKCPFKIPPNAEATDPQMMCCKAHPLGDTGYAPCIDHHDSCIILREIKAAFARGLMRLKP